MKTHFCRRPEESMLLFGLKITGWVILGIAAFTAFAFLLGTLIVYLWNWLMPLLFGIKTITFWQAIGLLVLARIIFGGVRTGGHRHGMPYRKHAIHGNNHHKMHTAPYSKWAYYDDYWQEEGEKKYEEYVRRKNSSNENTESGL
ncbi:MAG: hypothetical protein U0T82_08605 [Bacteroidales bacterium]